MLATLVAKFKRRNPSFVDDEPKAIQTGSSDADKQDMRTTTREELLAIFRARRSANGNRDILRVCDLLERRTSDVAKVRANQKDIDFQRE
jgi:hypothetical protein